MENEIQVPTDAGMMGESANLRHYWHVLLERRWLVLATFVSVFALCLIYLYRAPKVYRAETRIQIDRETESAVLFKDTFSMDSREQDYLQTQYKNLLSRTLIQSVRGITARPLPLELDGSRWGYEVPENISGEQESITCPASARRSTRGRTRRACGSTRR